MPRDDRLENLLLLAAMVETGDIIARLRAALPDLREQ